MSLHEGWDFVDTNKMKQQKGFFEIYSEMKLHVINDLIHKLTLKKDFRTVEELLKMKVELYPNQ
ncbi:hypothetical protein J4466_05645 [Candidatus Pacearchaeota archaeon]|nr:hypothetical protein [Candidatus Pacearchaeota archaeon]